MVDQRINLLAALFEVLLKTRQLILARVAAARMTASLNRPLLVMRGMVERMVSVLEQAAIADPRSIARLWRYVGMSR